MSSGRHVPEGHLPTIVTPEKEVVYYTGLESESEGKIVVPQPYEAHAYVLDPSSQPIQQSRSFISRKRFIVYASILIAIIIAVAIAIPLIVLRHKLPGQSTSTTPTSIASGSLASGTPTNPTATIPKPSGSIVLSQLSVNSWLEDAPYQGHYSTRLIYENQQGELMIADFSSKTQKWEKGGVGNLSRTTRAPFSVASFPRSRPPSGLGNQIEFIFADRQGLLQEVWWQRDSLYRPGIGSMSEKQSTWTISPNSSISGYWPFFFYVNKENELSTVLFEPPEGWKPRGFPDVSISTDGGDLSVVPAAQRIQFMSVTYRTKDGDIAEWIRRDTGESFSPKDPIIIRNHPKSAHFTTLAFASRPSDNSSTLVPLSTVLLYQSGTNNTIYYRYRIEAPTTPSGGTPWQSPQTHSAFNGAEMGTSITCTTGYSDKETDVSVGEGFQRCYFQVGSAIREVEVSVKSGGGEGLDWKIVGLITSVALDRQPV